jgi:hypothetical protein
VTQYWSATVYDRATHALIRRMPWPNRSSQTPGLDAPAGKDTNWVPTSRDGQFEVLFRFYGPTPPLFDKTWQLPDIESL